MQVSENHDIRIHDIVFLKSGSIPKTSSGKIERFACRAMYQNNTLKSAVISE
jgi:acyl-CoA synthetase (AMP-forming)/AMP-acid ligase II